MSGIYKDSKEFVDLETTEDSSFILEEYVKKPPANKTTLKEFVDQRFVEKSFERPFPSSKLPIKEYLVRAWGSLYRHPQEKNWDWTTLLRVPHPYVVPGERFREMYYWDSFFCMLGLNLSGHSSLVEGMLEDFSYMIDRYGFIPNANRSYYLSRSQPPFFSLMIKLSKDPQKYYKALEKEYGFWQAIKTVPSLPLNHYCDTLSSPRPERYKEDVEGADDLPVYEKNFAYHEYRTVAESGWDFSSRWWNGCGTIVTSQLACVDLNALLFHMEMTLGDLAKQSNDMERADAFYRAARARKEALNALCWDDEKGFYFDYNYVDKSKQPHFTLAALFPLFFGLASQEQADRVIEKIKSEFLKQGGLVTTLTNSGLQWDAPNGWAPLQWIAIGACYNYGYHDLGDTIAKRWLKTNEGIYKKYGVMVEKYNVVDPLKLALGAEYPLQHGFGWTNGVAQDLYNQEVTGTNLYKQFFYP